MTRLGPRRTAWSRFDFDAWLAALRGCVLARDIDWKTLSLMTGVSETTLSRMRHKGRRPDAASLAVLSAWAGLNPAKYVRQAE